MEIIIEILKSSTLFKGFGQEEIEDLLSLDFCSIREVKKDSYIFHQGDRPEYMYVLLEGSVQVEKIDINGKRVIVNIFTRPGTVFAEVYLYLGDHNYDYGCLAREDTRCLEISKDFFKEDSLVQKKVTQNMLEILSNKAFYLNQKLLIMGSFSLKQKIANYLLQKLEGSREVGLVYNREELADFLGTTRPSLSRELSNMEKEGLIRVKKGSIEVVSLEGLENII